MKKFLFSSLFVASSTLIAFELEASDLQPQNKWISDIVQEQPSVIDSFKEGKLYLKTENLFIGKDGIYLATFSQPIRIQSLHSDLHGCYIPTDKGIVVNCGNCGYEFEITELVTSCPNCGHGDG